MTALAPASMEAWASVESLTVQRFTRSPVAARVFTLSGGDALAQDFAVFPGGNLSRGHGSVRIGLPKTCPGVKALQPGQGRLMNLKGRRPAISSRFAAMGADQPPGRSKKPQTSFLLKKRFIRARQEVPTMSKKEMALMTGVLPSRT